MKTKQPSYTPTHESQLANPSTNRFDLTIANRMVLSKNVSILFPVIQLASFLDICDATLYKNLQIDLQKIYNINHENINLLLKTKNPS